MGLERGFVVVVFVGRGVRCHFCDKGTNLGILCCCVVSVTVVVKGWHVD